MSDLIDRQAAIDALRYAQHRFTVADEAGGMGTVKWREDVIYFAAAERVLTELPPAQPERIRGHWVNGRCDKCNEHAPFWAMASTYYESNFCPNCGADMREEKEK